MVLAALLLILILCAMERRPEPPLAPQARHATNPPRRAHRVDRWSLPAVRLLMVGAWSFTFAELASGRFPVGGLLAVALFTLIGSVVAHEMRSFSSPAELSLVHPEDEPERGSLSRR